MPTDFDFKKLRRLIMIYLVVQVALFVLLAYFAIQFQAGLGPLFWKSIIITLILQLFCFYPIYLFANREAKREVAAVAVGLTPEELKALRQKRLVGDVIKMGVFAFFLIFAYSAPVTPNILANRFTQSLIFFNFILTYLCYFQCFNFAAKREMKNQSTPQATP
jgi:predicted ferric reductase